MADGQHGGYRKPSSPAAVSGPGALSQRTDGRPEMATLPDAKYGEATDFAQIQQGSPLSPSAGAPMPSAGGTPPPGIMDDTAHPNMPVTSGADAGPGPGSDSLGLPNTTDEAADLARRYGGILPLLIRKADDPRSSQQFKDSVRYLLSKIG